MENERESRLPAWARATIEDLRKRAQVGNEPLIRELATLRPKVELLTRRNEALTELLECAARGGHMSAADIMNVLEGYSLTLMKE